MFKRFVILISTFLFFFNCQARTTKNVSCKRITVETAYLMINENKSNANFEIIDVRTEEEYKSGHINNSINIDFYNPNFKEKILLLNKKNAIVIYCKSGNRSSKALEIMNEAGFENVSEIEGGFTSWEQLKYPTVK